MLTCMYRRFSNGPISLKFMIEESHPFHSHSLQDTPLTQSLPPKFNIYAWYITRISNKVIPLSLNGIMYFLNDYCRDNTLIETYPNNAML